MTRLCKIFMILMLTGLLASSCIDRISLNGEADLQNKIVIEGVLTNEAADQEIVVSRSSLYAAPQFIPVTGCLVTIEDKAGNKMVMKESNSPGRYRCPGDPKFARIGQSYRLVVKTAGGTEYVSPFEEMLPCPKVDSVYYQLETRPTPIPGENEDGVQFYVNFKGDPNTGHFFRWNLEETYEYHSTWPVRLYVDKFDSVRIILDDFSNFVCYKIGSVDDIFTLSTNELIQNSYPKYPLHFVNNKTQRLLYNYSLLVRQYSLTEGEYNFWESIRKNNKESSTLYSKPPASLKSNIRNRNDSTEVVFGYFGVSAVTSKRLRVGKVSGLTFDKTEYCQAFQKSYAITPEIKKLKKPGLDSIPNERPLYYYPYMKKNGKIVWYWGNTDCFLCQLLGGITTKPSYLN